MLFTALPELTNAFSRRRTPVQFSPLLDEAPPPLENSRSAARNSFVADPIFTAAAPSSSSSSSRDRNEQQVLRRTRQEL
jgi:hypothetical protein